MSEMPFSEQEQENSPEEREMVNPTPDKLTENILSEYHIPVEDYPDTPQDAAEASDNEDHSAPEESEAETLDQFLTASLGENDSDPAPAEEQPLDQESPVPAAPAASPAPEVPAPERTIKKGRPLRKKGEGLLGIPNIISTLVWITITVAIGVTLGRLLWICATDVLAFGRQDRQVTVTIYEEDTIEDITNKLYNAKLIRYPGLFKFYAKFAVDDGEIKPGIWDLNTMYDYHALVKMMAPSSTREVVKVLIPEGYSCRQIFELMQDNKVCTIQDLAAYAANGELEDYWFLEGVERGDKYCLEGFLFPDTYEFYKNETPDKVLNKMLKNFDTRYTEELQELLPELNKRITKMMKNEGRNEEYIEKRQMTLRKVLTVASMIEKETSSTKESYDIASVIYNRLFSWGNTPSYLNIDATIVYALDGKTDLTVDDLQIDSPYNTYLNVGLPIGPISNPGLASIRAALEPNNTPYYFYVLDPSTGSHHFSRTQEEHNAFRASLGG